MSGMGRSGDSLYDATREGFSPSEIPADWTPRDAPTPFFVRAGDGLFRAVERAIMTGRIDSRSEIGDAALDYREIRQEMADAMADAAPPGPLVGAKSDEHTPRGRA